jgi:hypothetical protein
MLCFKCFKSFQLVVPFNYSVHIKYQVKEMKSYLSTYSIYIGEINSKPRKKLTPENKNKEI